ncbi:transcriptional regulator, AsnC family [Thermobaculum terrenum ATCC BAA-798]|uniref:Transcriptional regulator, AsnC family n=1 Tax=Thermobaculum terrenum (strain ATCC BAA-798 / CCMEE 7001 / YNP1) TaxID=525904 RepID=D1CC49_THET1|nr:Lrp/AsnC ligand binding domain-containing protein [Thermobaculum terrenum]ACZ42364.1 transcriptional regulator, AsnC family [Thermobaculum terrenum ATCC BAA-798]
MITALVEIDVERGRINEAAQKLVDIDGVAEVWSVTGDHDLVALLKLREYDQLSEVVTNHIASLPEVVRTKTMLAFKVYSKQELEEAWNIGVD